jgi:hypothetical protein
MEERRATPIRRGLRMLGNGERRPLGARLGEGEERRQSVRRCPSRMPRVDENLGVGREGGHLFQHLFEGMIIERGRNGDDGRHVAAGSQDGDWRRISLSWVPLGWDAAAE